MPKLRSKKQAPPLHHKLVRESIAIGSLFVALMLVVILASYDYQDPGSFYADGGLQVQNLAGYFGAWLASRLYYLLGFSAFLLPLLFVLAAFKTLRRDKDSTYIKLIKRLSGLLLLLSCCGLLTLHNWGLESLPATGGGIVGIVIANNTFALLGYFGANLLLLFLLIISISLFSGFSWLQIFEVVGGAAIYLANYLLSKLNFRQMLKAPLLPAKSALEVLARGRTYKPANSHDAAEQLPAKLRQELNSAKKLDPRFVFKPGESDIAKELEQAPEPNMTEASAGSAAVASAVPKLTPRIIRGSDGKKDPRPAAVAKPEPAPPKPEPALPTPESASPLKPEPAPSGTAAASAVADGDYQLPAAELLSPQQQSESRVSDEELQALGETLVSGLKDFGVTVQLLGYSPGPVVTRFEIEPSAGTKASRISNLANDLSRTLAVGNVRVVEFISGKSCIGIEVPNPQRQTVNFRSLLESREFNNPSLALPLALGSDISGKTIIVDLAAMPHLLVAGTTGSGKSVGINAMILSLLYKYTPQQLRLIMVDPKMLELASYNDIPNLLTPVITDMNLAAKSIGWCVNEMDRRYKLMAELGARNLAGYNQAVKKRSNTNSDKDPESADTADHTQPLPYIVIVIDEYADMIMVNRKVEDHLVRLAQKARAAGIHIILATQRPSVDVITGLIKANVPARIAFKVSSKVDSRTILDQSGAEQLLGKGDMLYLGSGGDLPLRVHGAFIPDEDINRVTGHCKSQAHVEYQSAVLEAAAAGEKPSAGTGGEAEKDELYAEAVDFVRESQRVSISSVQRKFKIGYNRAARIIEFMEEDGVVSPMDNAGKRSVLS